MIRSFSKAIQSSNTCPKTSIKHFFKRNVSTVDKFSKPGEIGFVPTPAKKKELRTIIEKVRRKKVVPPKPGDNKTGNILIDNAGKIGLFGFLSGCFYFYRGWKGGHNEDAAAEKIVKTLTIGTGEINELRASNPNFDLVQYTTFCSNAWKQYPDGRVTSSQFKSMVQADLQHLINEETRLPKNLLGIGGKELPIKGWYVLDRVFRRHPKLKSDNTYRLTDLLTSLSLCVDGELEDLIHALYTVALLDQGSEDLIYSMHTFPNFVETLIHSNLVPSRQQTRLQKEYFMYDYGQASAKDIAKTTVQGCVQDWQQKYEKGTFTIFKETIGWQKKKEEKDIEQTLLKNVVIPNVFGSTPPLTATEWVTDTFQHFTGNGPTEEELEDAKYVEETMIQEQEEMQGTILFKDFWWMMTSRHLCSMGSCHKLKKEARERAKKGISEEDISEVGMVPGGLTSGGSGNGSATPMTRNGVVNYRRVGVEASKKRQENLIKKDSTIQGFIKSETFNGPIDGYYYGYRAPEGLGYHLDYYGTCLKEAENKMNNVTE